MFLRKSALRDTPHNRISHFHWCSAGSRTGLEEIGKPYGVFGRSILFGQGLVVEKHFYDNAVIRPLRTATRRSWQPGGFGDSCLPDGIFHGALDYRFVEVMPTPDAVSRSM